MILACFSFNGVEHELELMEEWLESNANRFWKIIRKSQWRKWDSLMNGDFNRTMVRNTQLKQLRNGLQIRILMCWNGLANRQTWIQFKIYGEYRRKIIQARLPSNFKELKIFSNEEWDKIPFKCCQNLIQTNRSRLSAVIADKRGPIKY